MNDVITSWCRARRGRDLRGIYMNTLSTRLLALRPEENTCYTHREPAAARSPATHTHTHTHTH